VYNVSGLKELNLQNNLFTVLDGVAILKHLPSLTSLNLSNNQLHALPSELGHLQQLEFLDASSNRISQLPLSYLHLLQETEIQPYFVDFLGRRDYNHHSLKLRRPNQQPLKYAFSRHSFAPIQSEEKVVTTFKKLKLKHNPILRVDGDDNVLTASALCERMDSQCQTTTTTDQQNSEAGQDKPERSAAVEQREQRVFNNRVKRLNASRANLSLKTSRGVARSTKQKRMALHDI